MIIHFVVNLRSTFPAGRVNRENILYGYDITFRYIITDFNFRGYQGPLHPCDISAMVILLHGIFLFGNYPLYLMRQYLRSPLRILRMKSLFREFLGYRNIQWGRWENKN